MFWLCLCFPQLALEAVRVDDPDAPDRRPLAVVEGPSQRRRVLMADAAARKAGVHAGQPVTAAQMLCPRLVLLPRDEAAELQALQSLAAWAYRFSAIISLAAPDTVLVEVGGSLALFGGWPALERRLRSELAHFGFTFALAAAPTASAARVLATQADGVAIPQQANLAAALGSVPLRASGLDARKVSALHGMGLRNLRDLFRLPRAELARRIGEDALEHLDRLRGLAAETLPRWQPPHRFERRIEFSFGVESQAALGFPLQRLICELALVLVARDGGVQRFALVLGHERGACTTVEVGLLAPQRDAGSLFELARVRLERIDLPAPVHALTLRAEHLPPLCPLHRDLFDANRREQLDWPALAERLRARLGDAALQGLACLPDHRPARAWRFVGAAGNVGFPSDGKNMRGAAPASPRDKPRNAAASISAGNLAPENPQPSADVDGQSRTTGLPPAARPFWLLRRPILLREKPARILAGPERIESGWWDEHDQRRDYYIVETGSGQRAWVFVEAGTPVANGPAQHAGAHWTLHGWFA